VLSFAFNTAAAGPSTTLSLGANSQPFPVTVLQVTLQNAGTYLLWGQAQASQLANVTINGVPANASITQLSCWFTDSAASWTSPSSSYLPNGALVSQLGLSVQTQLQTASAGDTLQLVCQGGAADGNVPLPMVVAPTITAIQVQ
jgi:hypothetical protein